MDMSAELIGILGVGVTLLVGLGGLLLALLGELDAMGVTGKKRGGSDSPA